MKKGTEAGSRGGGAALRKSWLPMPMKPFIRPVPWKWLLSALLLAATLSGCAALHEKQGEWIFQPSTSNWGGGSGTGPEMSDVWIIFDSTRTGAPVRLHALWHAAYPDDAAKTAAAPVLLYLHGARWNVTGSTQRVRRMQEHDAALAPA